MQLFTPFFLSFFLTETFCTNSTQFPNAHDISETTSNKGRRSGRSGRQQRGDLKSVATMAGLSSDAADVVLVLSDVSKTRMVLS
jgi:hypothetical protein